MTINRKKQEILKMKLKKLVNTCLVLMALVAALSGCGNEDVQTGKLKVTYTNHPADLAV